jgi:glyoxylase-like metal-dependent hydrolase (beta-lactamase superfamily II)
MAGPPPASWAVRPEDAGARLVTPGLWRLRLPMAWEGIDHVNAYVIERDDGGPVLVDCGTAGHPTCAGALEAAMAQAGHALEDVALLVATHVHSDHIGLAALVLERSGAELWAHPDDGHFYDAIRDGERITAARERRARQEGVPEARLEPYRTVLEETEGALAAVAPHRPLLRGTVVESALGPWQVLETPGHCPSHVCLVQPDQRLAIVGDLVCPVFVPWMDYGYSADPVAETLASLDVLEQAPPIDVALPGHGRPITDLGAVVGETRAGFAQRLDATRAAVARGPAGGYAITTRMFGPEGDLAATGHLTEVLAYLAHLRHRGEVVRDRTPDGTYQYRAVDGASQPTGASR